MFAHFSLVDFSSMLKPVPSGITKRQYLIGMCAGTVLHSFENMKLIVDQIESKNESFNAHQQQCRPRLHILEQRRRHQMRICEKIALKLEVHTAIWRRCSLTRYTHTDLFRRFNASRLYGPHVTRPRTRIIKTGFQYRYPTVAKMNARAKISIILAFVGIGRDGNGNFASTRMPKPTILGRKIAFAQNIHFRTLQPIHIFHFNIISCVLRFPTAAINNRPHCNFNVRVFHGDAYQAFPKAPIQCVRVQNANAAFVLLESFSGISTIPTRCTKNNFIRLDVCLATLITCIFRCRDPVSN